MNSDDEWDFVQGEDKDVLEPAKSGALRISLLFGSIAVAFALFLVPLVNSSSVSIAKNANGPLDLISTGSVKRANEYTVRRSVLQAKGSVGCIIGNDGSEVGDC